MPQSKFELLARNFAYAFSRLGGEIVVGLLLTPLLIRALGFEIFGLLITIGASGLLLSIATRTIEQSVARELGFWLGRTDTSRLCDAFSSAFVLQLPMGSVLIAVGIWIAPFVVNALTIPDGYHAIARLCFLLTIVQFGIGVYTSPFTAMILAHQDLRLISLLELAASLVILLGAFTMLLWPGSRLLFFVSVQFAAFTVLRVVYTCIALARYREARPRLRTASLAAVRPILSYGVVAFINVAGTQARRNGLAVFMNVVFGNVAGGALGLASRLSALIVRVVQVVRHVVLPAMTIDAGSNDSTHTARLVSFSSMIAFSIAFPLAMPLLTDTEVLLELWIQAAVPGIGVLFTQIMVVGFVVTTVSQGHSLVMHADGRIGTLVLVGQAITISTVVLFGFLTVTMRLQPHWILLGEVLGMAIAACIWQPFWVGAKLRHVKLQWFRYTTLPICVASGLGAACAVAVCASLESGLVRAALIGTITLTLCVAVFVLLAMLPAERRNLLTYAHVRARRFGVTARS